MNSRKYVLFLCITCLLSDVLIFIPRFSTSPFFPVQVGMICSWIFTVPLYVGMIHSYIKKDYRHILKILLFTLFRNNFEFMNLPTEKVGKNFELRRILKAQMLTMMLVLTAFFTCQLVQNMKKSYFVLMMNIALMNIVVIASYYNPDGQIGKDIFPILTLVVPEIICATIFFNIHKENVIASIVENVQIYEHEKYKQMFDSLQEGVLVINTPKQDIKNTSKDECRLYFANELMILLLQKILDVPIKFD